MFTRVVLFVAGMLLVASSGVAQLSFEESPIHYNTAPVNDPFYRLQQEIESGRAKLDYDSRRGYLPALLEALDIPVSSQALVFSKTSLQIRKIDPVRPRALYFNDENYVGWVQGTDFIEIMSVDPRQGSIFYTMPQEREANPAYVRDRGECLSCHASSRTLGVPGALIRSVFPARDGQPIYGAGTFTITHESPIEERWGGYYVSGSHGALRHMGNQTLNQRVPNPEFDRNIGSNIRDISELVNVRPYLAPTSDIVALMVLEHQVQAQNLITRAGFEARSAMHLDQVMNEALEKENVELGESSIRRINGVVDKLVRYFLFCNEAELGSRIEGVSDFESEFAARGPFDSEGRSLRQFDLQNRLFKYPCSYMIYTPAFDALPPEVLERVYARMWSVLSGEAEDPEFAHLSAEDRRAIIEILIETKEGLPESWK